MMAVAFSSEPVIAGQPSANSCARSASIHMQLDFGWRTLGFQQARQ
jgi:hypothetical protein